MTFAAFIPARSGSVRVPGKNIRTFCTHPLIAYSIQSALESEMFSGVYVSSDSKEIGDIAHYYGADWIERPVDIAGTTSPDQAWIDHATTYLHDIGAPCQQYAILRPTSPFRTASTIKRAMWQWDHQRLLKAVERTTPIEKHHIVINPQQMRPYIPGALHLQQSSTLPESWVQNGSLELRCLHFSPDNEQPFFTYGYEGFDINELGDWDYAEYLVRSGKSTLPYVDRRPYEFRP